MRVTETYGSARLCNLPPLGAPYAIAFCKFSSSFARKACVFSHGCSGDDQHRQVARHVTRFHRLDAHLLQRLGKRAPHPGVLSNLPR